MWSARAPLLRGSTAMPFNVGASMSMTARMPIVASAQAGPLHNNGRPALRSSKPNLGTISAPRRDGWLRSVSRRLGALKGSADAPCLCLPLSY